MKGNSVTLDIPSRHDELGAPRVIPGDPATLYLSLPQLTNEQGEPMRLLASWLLGDGEGENFYSGTGGDSMTHTIPPDARGYRLRRWPSEGLAPEYLDWWFDGPRKAE